MPKLTRQSPGGDAVVHPLGERTVLGRAGSCDIVVSERGVSREHAAVERTGAESYEIVDLTSAQGTFVNGARVTRYALTDGDVISLGSVRLRFGGGGEPAAAAPLILLQPTEASVLRISEAPAPPPRDALSPEQLRADHARQARLLDLLRASAVERNPTKVMQHVLDAAFSLFPAERAALLTLDRRTGRLRPALARARHGDADAIVLSNSIVQEVVESRTAALIADAGTDARFSHASSIRSGGIRSAMCAPLLSGADLVGVLHIDSQSTTHAFDRADVELFRSLASHAALVVHRLQLDLADRTRWAQRQSRMAMLGQLAGRVSHDFNNSLAGIQAHAELIRHELPPGSPAREDIDGIHDAVQRAAALTGQLLAFAKREVTAPVLVSIDAAVADTRTVLERLAGEQMRLDVQFAGEPVHALIDPTRLEQVLGNLVVNARNASAPGNTITVAVARAALPEASGLRMRAGVPSGEYVRLSVRDTGAGMAPEVAARAFEPFFTTRESSGGTGLGLASVYGIVTQAGGGVVLDSEPGAGTTVTIYLPVSDEVAEREVRREATVETPVRRAGRRAAATVIVAEDDLHLNTLVCRMLQAEGFEVLQGTSGDDALRLAEQHTGRIDAVVSDVMMPGLTGPEWVAELRASRPAIGVVYMSGYPDTELAECLPGDRHEVFLAKPFTAHQLCGAVQRLIAPAARSEHA